MSRLQWGKAQEKVKRRQRLGKRNSNNLIAPGVSLRVDAAPRKRKGETITFYIRTRKAKGEKREESAETQGNKKKGAYYQQKPSGERPGAFSKEKLKRKRDCRRAKNILELQGHGKRTKDLE